MTRGNSNDARREYGSGSISQHADGKWTGRLTIGTNAAGKRVVKAVYGNTEKEVKHKLKLLRDEVAQHDYVNVQRTTVGKYMRTWLTEKKINELKPRSYDRLEQTVENQIIPFIGDIQLQALKTSDIQNMLNTMKTTGGADGNGYSYSSIKKAYDAVNECFRTGIISREVSFNPALGVTIPSKANFDNSEIKYYSKSEVKQLYAAARKKYANGKQIYRLGDGIILEVNVGLRPAELLALKWNDVDLTEGSESITIDETRVIVKDRSANAKHKYKVLEQKTGKTKNSIRVIPLNADAVEALKNLQIITGTYEYVLSTEEGRPIGQRYLDRLMRNIARVAGFPEEKIFGVHALRHTFATLLIENKVPVKAVSDLLGHTDVNITLNTYVHAFKEQKMEAVRTIRVPCLN